jgi:hypothetical protein
MISVRTVSDRTTPTMGVISTRAIVFRLRRLLQPTTYTRLEQVEKELETGLSRSKIGIFHFSAGVAQLVEHFLAKEDVASSSLVTRFSLLNTSFSRIYLSKTPIRLGKSSAI